jgi:mono/diheme cytochrome c family protein
VERVAAMVKTRSEPEVRLQLALSLGSAKTAAADEALRALVMLAGRQPFVADAVVSGLAGREVATIEALLKEPAGAQQAAEVVRYATSSTLKGGDAANIDRVLTLVGADGTPEWARSAMLGGVRHFLPKTPDGRAMAGNLPAEPKPLIALAERANSPSAPAARQLVALLKWPGKPGAATVAARPMTAEEQALFEKGKTHFATICAACHQANGQGLPGLSPSLVFSRWVLGDSRVLARILLNGKTQGQLFMPPWKGMLNDEAIASVLTYVRRSWGHEADPVDLATVAEARKAMASRDEPWTDADLEELLKELK